jgi:hypothetical protein
MCLKSVVSLATTIFDNTIYVVFPKKMKVENEKHFLLECPLYTYIRSRILNICSTTDIYILLTHENQDLGNFLSNIFYHKNKKLKLIN